MHHGTLPYYEANASAYAAKADDLDMAIYQARLISRLPPRARILDVGCGSGRDAAAFSAAGHTVLAVDGSEAMCAVARARGGFDVRRMLFSEIAFEAEFNGAWCSASLLHVPKEDEADALRRVVRSLVPGGVLVGLWKKGDGQCPDAEGRLFRYHTEDSLRALAAAVPELVLEKIVEDPDNRRPDVAWLTLIGRRTTI